MVFYKRWSHIEVQLYYTTYIDSIKKITGCGIKVIDSFILFNLGKVGEQS